MTQFPNIVATVIFLQAFGVALFYVLQSYAERRTLRRLQAALAEEYPDPPPDLPPELTTITIVVVDERSPLSVMMSDVKRPWFAAQLLDDTSPRWNWGKN